MEKLSPPSEFPFPFNPYPIQKDFMTHLYTALEEGKLGIFESPTGTGKSLSLICGALTWLRDHENRERERLKSLITKSDKVLHQMQEEAKNDSWDWFTEQPQEAKARQDKAEAKAVLDSMEKLEKKISSIRLASKERKKKARLNEKSKQTIENLTLGVKKEDGSDPDEDMLLLEEDELELSAPDKDVPKEEEILHSPKIFFCSRTHSQLAQFVHEVQRSPFSDDIRVVPLASRQNYCINNAVKKLKNQLHINEKCLDLQRKSGMKVTAQSNDGKVLKKACKSTAQSSCPAMNRSRIDILSQDILSEVEDVEQIVKAGEELKACPYYASRAAVLDSQVVVIPYNTLLHKGTRQACEITIKNNIVIIDEAHNLLEAIGAIHSTHVNGYQLVHSHSQLSQYRDKYHSRFKPSTLLYLNQVIFVVGKLIRILGGKVGCNPDGSSCKSSETLICSLPDFVISAEIDNMNIFKLLSFCQSSKIGHKLHSFSKAYGSAVKVNKPVEKTDGLKAFLKTMETLKDIKGNTFEKRNTQEPPPSELTEYGNNPFLVVMSFLESLTNECSDGRVLVKRELTVGKGSLKFLLLNPAAHFQDVINQARSVIVAGGTMEPISEFQNQLFISAGASMDRILHFSCGHIIPPENILPMVVGSGPSGKAFEFSYTHRDSTDMIKELGRFLLNVCNVVPAGIVCFFPSYDYEKHVMECFQNDGISIQIEKRKKIFREPKQSSDVEKTLTDYASCIRRSSNQGTCKLTGAILFSVIGGKLSEGLNFSDDLGRCVIVIGLPFPNIKSVELKEQMKFLDMTVGEGSGRAHYENLCMKAVNQSIGRAVRHKDDYAAVLLLDRRYLQKARQSSLPAWIQRSLQAHPSFGPAFRELAKFFQARRALNDLEDP